MASQQLVVPSQVSPRDIMSVIGQKYGIAPERVSSTLKSTAFKAPKGEAEVTDEQMIALLIVAQQYNLNPWTKELFAFPDKKGGIVPVVSVDGWARIINEQPALDGIEFVYAEQYESIGQSKACPVWIECVITRKDRAKPIKIREFLDEVYREGAGPWQSHTKRMLRHKALIQCARIAFGFAGIYDQDEAERIIDAGDAVRVNDAPAMIEGPRSIAQNAVPAQVQQITDASPKAHEASDGNKAATQEAHTPRQEGEKPLTTSAMRLLTVAIRKAGYVDSDGEADPSAVLEQFKLDSLDQVTVAQFNPIVDWLSTHPKT